MSNSRFVIALLLLVFVSPVIFASPGKHHNDNRYHDHERHRPFYGKVIFVKPIYKTVRIQRPQLDCVNHVPHRAGVTVVRQSSPERAIVGGLLGGIVGHELGNEHNRGITTLAGVVIGSAIASDIRTVNYQTSSHLVNNHRNCVEHARVIEQRRLIGYRVKYKYRGNIYTTRTRHHPGKFLPIRPGPQPIKRHL